MWLPNAVEVGNTDITATSSGYTRRYWEWERCWAWCAAFCRLVAQYYRLKKQIFVFNYRNPLTQTTDVSCLFIHFLCCASLWDLALCSNLGVFFSSTCLRETHNFTEISNCDVRGSVSFVGIHLFPNIILWLYVVVQLMHLFVIKH
jgi:hypothetical protein